MAVTPLLKTSKHVTPIVNKDKEIYTTKRINKKRQFVVFVLVFVFPLLSVFLLACCNLLGLEKSLKEDIFQNNFVESWTKEFGSFVKDYYLQNVSLPHDGMPKQQDNFFWGLPNPPVATKEQCEQIADNAKFDCYPRGLLTEKDCIARGCCYKNSTTPHVPFCFYPEQYRSYKFTNISSNQHGIKALLKAQFKSPYPKDIVNLELDFKYITNDILFVKISDSDQARYRFPFPEEPESTGIFDNLLYEIKLDVNKTGFQIVRKSNNVVVFDAMDKGGFIFSDQMIQMSAGLPSKHLYGLGEQRNNFVLDLDWNTISLFTHDSVPLDKVNGYGFHPFYLNMEDDGLSNGVLLMNFHAMDIVLQPSPAITYRVIGGFLGFLIMLGPKPIQVVEQYTSVIGRPMLPPYWSLGFHLSRFGYNTLDDMITIWKKTREAGIPFDTQWTDLDYMANRNDFTLDKTRYKDLKKFVDHLHDVGMHYVIIVDPGISSGEAPGTYPPYDEGLKQNIFVLDSSGKKPFVGKVWNSKSTVFVDFANPGAIQYWIDQIEGFHKIVPFDGIWIDMNEPSNFLNGSVSGCPKNNLENPPYVPNVNGGLLSYLTLCMSAVHHNAKHYDLHNIYGTLETVLTSFALAQVRNSRPFVISRSTAPGVGRFGGHWTGDVRSTWDDMRHSVGDIMSMSMFGVPMVGADICGFNGNTTVALCQRWSQLGAFYPFSRNHNSDDNIAQDPVSLGEEVVTATKKALYLRYLLLPYLYTLFWEANQYGTPVIQPLFFQFPNERDTYDINDRFMWGRSVLIAPVLEEGITYAKVYFSSGIWHNAYTNEQIKSKGQFLAIPAPLDTIPVFFRGGSVLPLQKPGSTTTESRKQPFSLCVILDEASYANGSLYWDDGDTIGGPYNLIEWSVSNGSLNSIVKNWKYEMPMILTSVNISAVPPITSVTINSQKAPFLYYPITKTLAISNFTIYLKDEFKIEWK